MKKLAVLFLSFLLVVCFVSCDKEDDNKGIVVDFEEFENQNGLFFDGDSEKEEPVETPSEKEELETPEEPPVQEDGPDFFEEEDDTTHRYTLFKIEELPLCKKEGVKVAYCKDCGKKKSTKVAPDPENHNYGTDNVCIDCGFELKGTENLIYRELEDKTYGVADCYSYEMDIVIPAYFNGIRVTAICEDAFKGDIMNSIYIPNTIEWIGENAFNGVRNLEKVVLPDSVKELNYQSFANCSSLHAVYLSDSLEEIPMSCFENCSSLMKVYVVDLVRTIGSYAFKGCVSLNDYYIGSGTEIGEGAFENCTSLTNYNIPDDVIMAYNSFMNTPIYTNEAYWEDSVFYINKTAVYVRGGGTSLNLRPDTEYIARGAFKDARIETFTLPESITVVPASLFWGNNSIKEVVLHDKVTIIEASAFMNCKNLATVNLPEGLKIIGSQAFQNCSSLKELDLPESLDYLGYQAIEFTGLKKENVAGVTYYDGWATYSYSYPEEITLPENTKGIAVSAFTYSMDLKVVHGLERVIISGNPFYKSAYMNEDGSYSFDSTFLAVPRGETVFEVPDGTTHLVSHALSNNSNPPFEKVTLPKSVKSVDYFVLTKDIEIYYEGSAEDFFKIEMKYGNDYDISKVHFAE